MRLSKRQLRRILRKVITEQHGSEHLPDHQKEGTLDDIIDVCVRECRRDPDCDIEGVCEKWASMYGIPYKHVQTIIDAVYQQL